jgi:putative addiction module component (TIGR02574 family)
MKKHISMADVLRLSVSERIQFVEDIWDTIATVPENIQLTEHQKKELDKRLASYHNNPNAGSPWQEVKKRILSKK